VKTDSRPRVLEFIRGYVAANHRAPTYREITDGCGFKSPRAASYQVERLIERGELIHRPGSRGLLLPETLNQGHA
jgi:repressor LexA